MGEKIVVLTAFLFSAGLCLGDCPSADFTGDCFVDYQDLALMSVEWLWASARIPPADLNHDHFVDFNDFAVMAAQWRTGDPCVPDDMVSIQGGTFEMGDSFAEGGWDELPVHTVTVDSFYMGSCEVTNRQYCDYLNSALSQGLITVVDSVVYKSAGIPYCNTSASSNYSQIAYSGDVFSVLTKNGRDMSNDPMYCVSWYGAAAYCNWRSRREGREECYDLSTWDCDFSRHGYRLATEAEWEYAARGGLSGRRFPWGDTISHSQANYQSVSSDSYDVSPTTGYHPSWNDGIFPYTSVVGSFAANAYGLRDMAGNLREWCNDRYSDTYYSSSPTNNPTGPGPTAGSQRVLRGGSWAIRGSSCRVTFRIHYGPGNRYYAFGFRLVLDLE